MSEKIRTFRVTVRTDNPHQPTAGWIVTGRSEAEARRCFRRVVSVEEIEPIESLPPCGVVEDFNG